MKMILDKYWKWEFLFYATRQAMELKKKNGIYKKNFASALFCFIRYSGSVFIYRSSGSFFFIVFTFLMEMLK